MSLTKAMYGDLSCNLFGLKYGQIKIDAVIQNAGWYNSKGEKLGYGDLNLDDLTRIRRNLPPEYGTFIILSEGNSLWNVPAGMDKTAPGIEYVMENASWVVDSACVYRVANMNTEYEWVDSAKNAYLKCTRPYLFAALHYPKDKVAPAVCDDQSYYGLKTIYLADSVTMNIVLWAYGSLDEFEAASLRKAEDMMWLYVTYSDINKFVPISVEDMNSLDSIIEKKEQKANGMIRIILGNKLPDFIQHLAKKNRAELMSPLDGEVYLPGDIAGIPHDKYCVRI
jgi:hypothetical protein